VVATATLVLISVVPMRGTAPGTAREIPRAVHAKQMALDGAGEPALARLFAQFYAERHYRPAWVELEHLAAARELLVRVSASHEDGLCPKRYEVPWLRDRLASRAPGRETAASFDVELTAALLRYVVHLGLGYHAGEARRASARPLDVRAVFEALRNPRAITRTLADLQVRHPEYERLREALADYRRIVLRGGWERQPDDLRLRPRDGAPTRLLWTLARRLQATGDLAIDWVPGVDARHYHGELVHAVNRFQRRHGLVVDGIVGPATLRALNVPAAARLAQIEINLDRWRRLPDDLGVRHVQVNVPAFTLAAVQEGRTAVAMRAIVGVVDSQTPAFSDRIQYLEFNPYWNVPDSIVRNEIALTAVDDPSQLIDRGFEVLDGWGEEAASLDPFAVDWEAERFQYRVRQLPGPENALGRVKFMFPNAYSVYLHDTPARHLFQKNARALSHGCVRVEQPARLAEWLLPQSAWPSERIHAAMTKAERTVVPLEPGVPVHLLYFTAWVDTERMVHFRDDVYGRDRVAREWLGCGGATSSPPHAAAPTAAGRVGPAQVLSP
jgi:murein L,D-transpeptidase YcbB/YkuD